MSACRQVVRSALDVVPAERETSAQVADLVAGLGRLQAVLGDLRRASLSIGYLESSLRRLRQEAGILPAAGETDCRLEELERLNRQMRLLAGQARLADRLEKENAHMRELVLEKETSGRARGFWPKSMVSACGKLVRMRPQPLDMGDYYLMVKRSLDG